MSAFRGSFEEASVELASTLKGAVTDCVAGSRKVAVGFSGGLDSSVLAVLAARQAEVVLCTGFAPGSHDSEGAIRGAKALGLEFVCSELSARLVSEELMTMHIPFEPSPMDRSLWVLYSVVSKSARDEGAESILLGQLADELFGGYAKYAKALESGSVAEAREMMENDVRDYSGRGMLRDVGACSRWVPPKFPFTSEPVVRLGLSLPVEFKIREGVRKAVLRRAARILGVPEELAEGPKRAAQYSSGIQKLLR